MKKEITPSKIFGRFLKRPFFEIDKGSNGKKPILRIYIPLETMKRVWKEKIDNTEVTVWVPSKEDKERFDAAWEKVVD